MRAARRALLRAGTAASGAAALAAGVTASAAALVPSPARAQVATPYERPLDLDVPFVTTPDNVVDAMLALAGVGPADRLLDLGSGDGRIPIVAARRWGTQGVGVEIDPSLVEQSRRNAQAAGVAARVRFAEQDLFETDLSQATVITMYLLPDVNMKLRPALAALAPGVRIVSHDWDLEDWVPDRRVVVPAPGKTMGLRKEAKLMLWVVPAAIGGRHAGDGLDLTIDQRWQQVGGGRVVVDGRAGRLEPATIEGGRVRLQATLADGGRLTLACDLDRQPAAGQPIAWTIQGSDAGPARRVTRRQAG